MRLRSLLFIVSSVITLIPVVFFGIWPHTHAFQNEIDRVSEQHVLIAQNIARVLERYDRDVKAAFRLLAKNAVEHTPIEHTEVLLASFHFRNICVVDPRSLEVVHALNAEGHRCPKQLTREEFQAFEKRAADGNVQFTSVMAGLDGAPLLYLTYQLEELLAVGAINTDYIVELGKGVAFGERGHAAIVDHTGTILAHPLASWRQERRNIAAVKPIKRMLERQTGVVTFFSPAIKEDLIAGYTWVKGSNWGVMVPQPLSELRARADTAQRNALGVIVLGVLAAALVSWFVSGYLTRPVLAVVAAARRMTAGDSTARTPEMGRLAPSEMKELGSAFNTMAEAVEQDLKTRKDVERALRESEARFRAFNDNSPTIMHIKDMDLRFVLINKRSAEFMDATEGEILGHTSSELFSPEQAELFEAHDRAVIESGEAVEREEHMPHGDGSRIYLTVKFPIRDETGRMVAIGAAGTDITQHKKDEEQLRQAQKMEAIGQLTGGVAHDFNNLLSVIQGNLEALQRRIDDDQQAQTLASRAMAAAARGAELVRRLLAFSRKQALKPRDVDIAQLFTIMSDLLKRTLGETIEVEMRHDETLWFCLADPHQLESALLNLAINARDAMPRGGRLKVEAKNVVLDGSESNLAAEPIIGEFVALTVSDTGDGMPPEIAENAFDPFFTTKDVGAGSGLGLSMVYGFARQSAGHVTIASQVGQGTAVTLYLPRSNASQASPPTSRDSEEPRGKGETILVVEDEAEVRQIIANALDELGYQALEAGSGRQALEIENGSSVVDLLLSDVILPGDISGPELADTLRDKNPSTKVLFMSGYPADELARDGRMLNDSELIMKPFKMPELARRVRARLDA